MAEPLASIVSTGISYFGRREGVYARELFREAAEEAFSNSPNLDPRRDLEAIFVGQMSDLFEHQSHVGAMISDWLALSEIPAMRIEAACASSGAALRSGIMAVASRLCDVVLVGGVEKMTHISTPKAVEALATAADYPMEQWNGVTFPGLYALMATAHMNRYGTTEEQLGLVAVKNHRNGAKNPKAHLRKEVTLEDVLNSRMIAWPLKLYDCSLITDGASCAILTRPELAKNYTDTPIHIIASAQSHDTLNLADREDLTTLKAARKAAQQAYEMAGIKPRDVDVAEVHDCFTIAELMAYEDLGFCKPGLGGKLIQEGVTEIGGDIPVNPSGGLKSKGHPVGATGVAQVHEIFLQLRGEAGQRQVPEAEIGLTHNVGGSGATAVIHIFRRGD
ncbi:MAG: thiolase domain-containing protein [Candidatus Bathyarchaeia archaeon]